MVSGSPVRVAMAKREAPGGAIQKWLAENETRRPTRGGRGLHGDLSRFLLKEAADVHRGREERGLTWNDVAQAAAAVGVVKADGRPYPAASFSTVWGRLTKKGKIARVLGQGVPAGLSAPVPTVQRPGASVRDAVNEMVPAPRGQAGTMGAGGVQPPAPMPPTTAISPAPMNRTGEAAPEEPTFTAVSMPVRRRFGDRIDHGKDEHRDE